MKSTYLVAFVWIAFVWIVLDSSALGQNHEWTRQLGTQPWDASNGVSVDALGNVYVAGHTRGSLRETNAGVRDGFVSQYDVEGELQWTRQLGTSAEDRIQGVSADGLGNVYVSGLTEGSLGARNEGGLDAFISKYDVDGEPQWTRQLGSGDTDQSWSVSADGLGNVYITGGTGGSLGESNSAGGEDAFVSKYDAEGEHLWTQQLGTSRYDRSWGVSADGLGSVYITGWTNGSLAGRNVGGSDAFISKFNSVGELQWTEQLGSTAQDEARGVSADGLGNVYISGWTRGKLSETSNAGGGDDAFVSKYDGDGQLQWTQQFGSRGTERSLHVSADGVGVYISGWTEDSPNSNGGEDALVTMYDTDGNLQWTEQLGTGSDERSFGVSADGLGNVYIAGWTGGSLDGANAGSSDAFVAKFRSDVGGLLGDFDGDMTLSAADADLMVVAILNQSKDPIYDLDGGGGVDTNDLDAFLRHANRLNGDANFDGDVSFHDFVVLSGNFGDQQPWSQGDFNANGVVDFSDFAILSTNYGKSATPVVGVPEPGAKVILATLFMGCLCFGRSYDGCRPNSVAHTLV